jgi:anthranilate synthase
MEAPQTFRRDRYLTRGGLAIDREVEQVTFAGATRPILEALDARKGALFASNYEYPGRYTQWDIGFVDPPIEITARARHLSIRALNERGHVMLPAIAVAVERVVGVSEFAATEDIVSATVVGPPEGFSEEERSRQPSVFSVVRAILDLFQSASDAHLGLYGAFGYDLAFQFEPVKPQHERPRNQRDLVLYLPDELVVVDNRRHHAAWYRYDFEWRHRSTQGIARTGANQPYTAATRVPPASDHYRGEYAACVRSAKERFRRGDLFEVVPSQTFFEPCPVTPSRLFLNLSERNPSPYGFLINLGRSEYLVGASPEMYVRVRGDRVETCPISGTIPRGNDAIGDAAQIVKLLNSSKDESELTMCTDVDRNDKSRVCRPGSVRVIGRRQIELYSRLIHTVDHVEGRLREGFDALDAFLTHTWAVTVTGAPKPWAMQYIEDREKSARSWYGGAVGWATFDGNLNTGLTIRTIHVMDGVARIRVGATLLYDSDPEDEERETRLKAAALLDAVRSPRNVLPQKSPKNVGPGEGKRVVLVDHQDSFVHTLADYFRQTGAEVVTLRSGFPAEELDRLRPSLVVLSPGPGRPEDFNIARTLRASITRRLPVFGVCLGLQAAVEYFGGELGILPRPKHGEMSRIKTLGGRVFKGLPEEFDVGSYHSLFALRDKLPSVLDVTAENEDGMVMAIEHRDLPLAAVQFHPESILSLSDDVGLRLVRNAVSFIDREERSALD